jgi:hypothetical protein
LHARGRVHRALSCDPALTCGAYRVTRVQEAPCVSGGSGVARPWASQPRIVMRPRIDMRGLLRHARISGTGNQTAPSLGMTFDEIAKWP